MQFVPTAPFSNPQLPGNLPHQGEKHASTDLIEDFVNDRIERHETIDETITAVSKILRKISWGWA